MYNNNDKSYKNWMFKLSALVTIYPNFYHYLSMLSDNFVLGIVESIQKKPQRQLQTGVITSLNLNSSSCNNIHRSQTSSSYQFEASKSKPMLLQLKYNLILITYVYSGVFTIVQSEFHKSHVRRSLINSVFISNALTENNACNKENQLLVNDLLEPVALLTLDPIHTLTLSRTSELP